MGVPGCGLWLRLRAVPSSRTLSTVLQHRPLSSRLVPYPAAMPRAIISPSVLASDFGQLTAECKRMLKGGAEWLHMGQSSSLSFSQLCTTPRIARVQSLTLQCRCHGRVTALPTSLLCLHADHASHNLPRAEPSHFVENITMGAYSRDAICTSAPN